MAKYVIEDTTLIGIADAIREKEGSTAAIPVPGMKQRILDIQTGIDTSDATATEPEVTEGETFYANGEKKTGTMPKITGIETELAAGESYDIPLGKHDGTGKVIAKDLASQTEGNADENSIVTGNSAWVNGIKVNGAIPIGTTFNSATEIELAAGESLEISKAYYSKGGTIKAKNLASQTVGDAAAADIRNGKKVWVNGEEVTGIMPEHSIDTTSVEWRLSSVPPNGGDATMVVDVEEGYYEAGAYPVGTLAMYQPSDVTPGTADIEVPGGAWFMNGFTVAGDANLVAENIKSGVSIFGVEGSVVEQEDLSSEISTQQSLISQIETALANKAAAS